MSKLNKKPIDRRFSGEVRLAGTFGQRAAVQDAEAQLRRAVLANLLWEDNFYQDGKFVATTIKELIPQVSPEKVAQIAYEARTKQKLRHIPLFIIREMARYPDYKRFVGDLLPDVCTRPDMITDFLALYWKDGKCPISKQVKLGLARAMGNFDGYQLAKYNRDTEIKLRDVLFMTHPNPMVDEGEGSLRKELYHQLAKNTLPAPDTWEVALSTGQDKKETWERLITDGKLGALAFLRNLRNMERANVNHAVIRHGFEAINSHWLLPLNFFAAAKSAPRWIPEIEQMMFRTFSSAQKLRGYTILVVDVSGSMGYPVSTDSKFSRIDVARAMAIITREMCERVSIYATAGVDHTRVHATKLIPAHRGFDLVNVINGEGIGHGGIFTRQCLDWIKQREQTIPDRIIVFSDSQDCDYVNKRVPDTFGVNNYIADISAHTHGINYKGVWTAEVSGWSEHFLEFISAFEGNEMQEQDQE